MGQEQYRYAAFISYRHDELGRKWANWLLKTIERYRVPTSLRKVRSAPKRVGKVFRDEEELAASADLSTEIDRALQDSRYLIVICTPSTPQSRWVDQEVQRFRAMGRGDRVLALLVEGDPRTSFPPALVEIRRTVVESDGTRTESVDTIEPLAADVRNVHGERFGHVKGQAKLRLIATLLGVGYDELVRRDARARMGRALATAAVAVGVTALTGALAVYAFGQKTLAEDRLKQITLEQEHTRIERDRAERRSADVQGLAETVMFDVHDKVLTLPGATPAIDLITRTARQYLERLEADARDDPKLQRNIGVAYTKLGDAQVAQGDLKSAAGSFDKGMIAIRKVVESDPANHEAQRDLSVGLERLGDVRLNQGDAGAAQSIYAENLALRQKLADAQPDNVQARGDLAMAHARVGDAQQALADLPAAARSYTTALEYSAAVATGQRVTEVDVRNYLFILHKLGDVQLAQSEVKAAADTFARGVLIARKLADMNANAVSLRNVSVAYLKLGDVQQKLNDLPAAAKSYDMVLTIRRKLAELDRKSAAAQRDYAVILDRVGDVQRAQGDIPSAVKNYEASLAISKPLADANPTSAAAQRDVVASYQRLRIVHTLLWADEKRTADQRRASLLEARQWGEREVGLWETMKQKGMLAPADAGLYEKAKARCAELNAAAP